MQHSPEDLKQSLIACIDEDSNVTDMAACLVVISLLEHTPVTRKILEDTRLGKYVNEIRRRTRDHELSKRLKNLVRKWRDTCQAEGVNGVLSQSSRPTRDGGNSKNGRQSISPPISAPSSINGPGSIVSPGSLPSSGNTSPVRMMATTTAPSLYQKGKNLSPCITVAKGSLSSSNTWSKGCTISPRLAAPPNTFSPIMGTPSHSVPHSPSKPRSVIHSPQNQVTSKLSIPYTPYVENVPRTNAANKRLRKEMEEVSDAPPSKKFRNNLSNGFEDECSRDSVISVMSIDRVSRTSGEVGSVNISVSDNGVKLPIRKSGRKRKRKGELHISNSSAVGVDPLRQKMAVIGAKSSKVKTTSQLVAELAERKGDLLLARKASRLEEQVKDKECFSSLSRTDADSVTLNKIEHMEKFLKSTPGPPIEFDDEITIIDDDSVPTTVALSPSPIREPLLLPIPRPNSPLSNVDLLGITVNETAEEILSRLPTLDLNTIIWEDPSYKDLNEEFMSDSDSDNAMDKSSKLTKRSEKIDSSFVQTLHSTNVECQNGNFDMDGRFREWHEVIQQKAYQDSPLVVLPYVITDF